MPLYATIGFQWGDEGKGKTTNLLEASIEGTIDMYARTGGGANAGHTLEYDGRELDVHQIPSGITHEEAVNVLANGCLVDPVGLVSEMNDVRQAGIHVSPDNLRISKIAHLVFPFHKIYEAMRENGDASLNTTKQGISFAAADKYGRTGLQAYQLAHPERLIAHMEVGMDNANKLLLARGHQLVDIEAAIGSVLAAAEVLTPYLEDTVLSVNLALNNGATVLAEGAQATGLDMELQPYPYGTSSHTGIAGALVGLSVAPDHIKEIVGVIKAVKSQVGNNPFVTKIHDEVLAAAIRGKRGDIDGEYGKTSGRKRDIGHIDIPELRLAQMVNHATMLVLNKVDHLPRYGDTIHVATQYNLDGTPIDYRPTVLDELKACTPICESLPAWQGDISGITNYTDLPKEAKYYIAFVGDKIGKKIDMIGVGPGPTQIIAC